MKIMDSRVPIGTMLTSPRNGEIVIKGGATWDSAWAWNAPRCVAIP